MTFRSEYTLMVVLSLLLSSCFFTHVDEQAPDTKIRGVSLEGSSDPIEADFFDEITAIHGDWVCLMPYAYSERNKSELIFKNLEWQWWGEGVKGTSETVALAHQKGIKVMIKPHLWLGHNLFTGDMTMKNEDDWLLWEKGYHDYIMTYAHVADSMDAELFCIGTELEQFVQSRPRFWDQLITDVRQVYKGRLTYAANWNEFQNVPFWNRMDYIGIDAYFPLAKEKNPSIELLTASWEPWVKKMEQFQATIGKPIIFTEYGYQSVEYCAATPWSNDGTTLTSNSSQSQAYEALYISCWNQPWMAGGFLWKWHVPDHKPKTKVNQFTPQYKPALDVVESWYGR